MINLNKNEDAIICLDKAIELDLNYSLAFRNKGAALEQLNRLEEALHCFNKAIELDPNFFEAIRERNDVLNLMDASNQLKKEN